MCGIAGVWSRGAAPADARVSAVLSALRHRGPDDVGHWVFGGADGTVLLAQTRLSIIDLSDGGHQPMTDATGRFTIVFNGEIYNYRELRSELGALGHAFHSSSDTEVLLAAWSEWREASLRRIDGMFAFAVHDARDNGLTLVRDAFGIKPLYYHADDGLFAFASEPGALATLLGRTFPVDMQRAYDYLATGICGGDERTFMDGVSQLLPSHVLQCNGSTGQIEGRRRWWQPSIHESGKLSFPQAVEAVRDRFLSSVRLHLRSDVPIGSALSGGIDSSAVVCAMRALEPDMPIHTFTYAARGSAVDEESWADAVNAHVGAVPHKVVASGSDLAADLDDMIRAQGEPFGSTSIYAQYRVYRLAREAGVKVTLDGQGADELLAGYDGYPDDRLLSLAERRQIRQGLRLARAWPRSRKLTQRFIARLIAPRFRRTSANSGIPAYLNAAAVTDAGLRVHRPILQSGADAHGRRLVSRMRDELMFHSIPHLLRYADRNSMRWSLEARVPFLTRGMTKILYSLPEEYLLSHDGQTKHVFRAAMRGIVPNAVLDRRDKVGFETPEREWLMSLASRAPDWLEGLDSIAFVDQVAARALVDDALAGRRPYTGAVWRLVNLGRWAQLR